MTPPFSSPGPEAGSPETILIETVPSGIAALEAPDASGSPEGDPAFHPASARLEPVHVEALAPREEAAIPVAPRQATDADYQVQARALCGFAAALERKGVDFRQLSRQAGLDRVDTARLDAYVSLTRFAHFLELAADATQDELFALRWVAEAAQAAVGSYSLCLAYAPNLRSALGMMLRYLAVHIDVESSSVTEDGDLTTYSFRYSPLVLRQEQLIDRGMGLCVTKMRSLLPERTPPTLVELARPRPRSTGLHGAVFGPNVVFDSDRNAISYPTALLDVPNPNADPNLFIALCALNDRLLAERSRQRDFVSRVREEILRRLAEDSVALDVIARELGHSSRGLQRRLAQYNTTFQDLLESTRREAAKRYIEETDYMISEIAYRLGFSAIGNFTRAAKRWFGCTPREYRQGLQSAAKRV